MSRIMTRSRTRRLRLVNEVNHLEDVDSSSRSQEVDFNNNDIGNGSSANRAPFDNDFNHHSSEIVVASPNDPNVLEEQEKVEENSNFNNTKAKQNQHQQNVHWTFFSVSNKLLPFGILHSLSNWLSRIKWKRKSRNYHNSVLTLILVFILLALTFFCTNVLSVCVWQGGGGFRLACGFKQSGLFRLRSLGGLKGWAGAGFTIGDEDGFKDSMTNTDPQQSQQRTGIAAAVGNDATSNSAKQRIGRYAGAMPASLAQAQGARYLQQPSLQFQQQYYPNMAYGNRKPGGGPILGNTSNKKSSLWESWKWPSLSKKKGLPAPPVQPPQAMQRMPMHINYPQPPPLPMNHVPQQQSQHHHHHQPMLPVPQRPPIGPPTNQMQMALMNQHHQQHLANGIQRQGLIASNLPQANFPSFSPMPEFPALQDDNENDNDNLAVESSTTPLASNDNHNHQPNPNPSSAPVSLKNKRMKKPYGLELLENSDNFGKKFKLQSNLPKELENTVPSPITKTESKPPAPTNLGYDTNVFPDIYFTTTSKSADKLNKILRVDPRHRVHNNKQNGQAAVDDDETEIDEASTTESLMKKLKLKKFKLIKKGNGGGYIFKKKGHRTTTSGTTTTTTEHEEEIPEEISTTFRSTTAKTKRPKSTTFQTTSIQPEENDDESDEEVDPVTESFRPRTSSSSTTTLRSTTPKKSKAKGKKATSTTERMAQEPEEEEDNEDQVQEDYNHHEESTTAKTKNRNKQKSINYPPPPKPRIPGLHPRNTERPLRPDYGDEFEYQMPTKVPMRRVTHYGHTNLLKDNLPTAMPTIMASLRRERPNPMPISPDSPFLNTYEEDQESLHSGQQQHIDDLWRRRLFMQSTTTTESPFNAHFNDFININPAAAAIMGLTPSSSHHHRKPYDPRYPPDHEINQGAIPPASLFSTPVPTVPSTTTELPFYMRNSYFNPNSHFSRTKSDRTLDSLSSSLKTTQTTALSEDVGPYVKFDSGESYQFVNKTRSYNSQFYSHFNKSAAPSSAGHLTGSGTTKPFGTTRNNGQQSFSSRSGGVSPSSNPSTIDYHSYFASSTTPKPSFVTEYPENPSEIVWPWERPSSAHSPSSHNSHSQHSERNQHFSHTSPRSLYDSHASGSSEYGQRWSSPSQALPSSPSPSASSINRYAGHNQHSNHRYIEDSAEQLNERQKALNLLKNLPYWRQPFLNEPSTGLSPSSPSFTSTGKYNRDHLELGLGPASAEFVTDDNFKKLPKYLHEPERSLYGSPSSKHGFHSTMRTTTEAPTHYSTPSFQEWKGYVESVGIGSDKTFSHYQSPTTFTTPKPKPPPIISRRRMYGSSTTPTPQVINRGSPDPYEASPSNLIHSRTTPRTLDYPYRRTTFATPTPPPTPTAPYATETPDYGYRHHYGNHEASSAERRMLLNSPSSPAAEFAEDFPQKKKNFKIIVIDNIEDDQEKEALVRHFSTTARPIHASPSTMIFDASSSTSRSSTTMLPPILDSSPNAIDNEDPRDTSMDPIENLQEQIKKLSEQSHSVLHKFYHGGGAAQRERHNPAHSNGGHNHHDLSPASSQEFVEYRRHDIPSSTIAPYLQLDPHQIRLQQFEELKRQFELREREEAERFRKMSTTMAPPTITTTMRPYLQSEPTIRNYFPNQHQQHFSYHNQHQHQQGEQIQQQSSSPLDHFNFPPSLTNILQEPTPTPTPGTSSARDRDTVRRIVTKHRYNHNNDNNNDISISTIKPSIKKRKKIQQPVTITSHDVDKTTLSPIPATNLLPPGYGKRKPFIPNQTIGPPPPLPDFATIHLNDFENPMQQHLNNQLETEWELYSVSGVKPLSNTASPGPSPSAAAASPSPSPSPSPSQKSPSLKQRLKDYHLNKKFNPRDDHEYTELEERSDEDIIVEETNNPSVLNKQNIPILPSSHFSVTPSSTTALSKHIPVRHMLPAISSTPMPVISSTERPPPIHLSEKKHSAFPSSTQKYFDHSSFDTMGHFDDPNEEVGIYSHSTSSKPQGYGSSTRNYDYDDEDGLSSNKIAMSSVGPTKATFESSPSPSSFRSERPRTTTPSTTTTTTTPSTTTTTPSTTKTTTTTTEKPKSERETILMALETLSQAKSHIVESIVNEKFGGGLPNDVIKVVPSLPSHLAESHTTTTTAKPKRLNQPSPTPNLLSYSVATKIASLLNLNPPTAPSLSSSPSPPKSKGQNASSSAYEVVNLGPEELEMFGKDAASGIKKFKGNNNVEIIELNIPDPSDSKGNLPHGSPTIETMIQTALNKFQNGEKLQSSMMSFSTTPYPSITRRTSASSVSPTPTTTTRRPIIINHTPSPSPSSRPSPFPSPTARSQAQAEIAQKLTQMGILHKLSTNNLTDNQIQTLKKLLKLNKVEEKIINHQNNNQHQFQQQSTTMNPIMSNDQFDIIKVDSNMDLNKILGNLRQQQEAKKQLQAATATFNNRILPVNPSMMSFVGDFNNPHRPANVFNQQQHQEQQQGFRHYQQQQQNQHQLQQIPPQQFNHRIIHSGSNNIQNILQQPILIQPIKPGATPSLINPHHFQQIQQQMQQQQQQQNGPPPSQTNPNLQQLINQHHKQQQLQILNNPTLKALQALALNRAQTINPSPTIQFPQQVAPGGEPVFVNSNHETDILSASSSDHVMSGTAAPAVDYVDLSPLFGGDGSLLKRNAQLPLGYQRITNIRKAPKSYHPSTETGIIGGKDNSTMELLFDPIPTEMYTTFQCQDQKYFPGLYADPVNSCEVFHLCAKTETGIMMKTFRCPQATVFDQEVLRCNWNLYVDCSSAQSKYDYNKFLSQSFQFLKTLGEFSSSYQNQT